MKKIVALMALGVIAGAGSAEAAVPAGAKYEGACAYHVATTGEVVPTECKVTWTDPKEKATYCFATEEMKKKFAESPEKFEQMADANFAKAGKGGDHAGADAHGDHAGHDGHDDHAGH